MSAEERFCRPIDHVPANFTEFRHFLEISPPHSIFTFVFAGVTAALEPLNETKKDYEEMVSRWEVIGMFDASVLFRC